jgi:hypothetical protein
MAITEQRDTQERLISFSEVHEILGASSTTFIKGGMVAINAAGLLVMASSATGLRAVGRCEENVVTGAGNTRLIKCKTGIFKWANAGAAPVVQASLATHCFIEDNETVRVSDDTSSFAGRVLEVVSDGVWVAQDHLNPVVVDTA